VQGERHGRRPARAFHDPLQEPKKTTRDFYREYIGLEVGARPNFPFKGYWLYLGGVPVVHLVEESEHAERGQAGHTTGGLDHIAFRAKDLEATVAKLKRGDIKFREAAVPDFRLHQIFLHDPDGIQIELNFRDRPATSS
jgi:catechol 2,3-dioxygenase-like lactoylglutathione lyase family enzyme